MLSLQLGRRAARSFAPYCSSSPSSSLSSALYSITKRLAQPCRTTTVLAVRRDDTVTVVGDGQVTLGSTVVKPNARKVRRLGSDKKVIAGFAGATADALTLIDRLETKIDEYPDQLLRACVNLAKDWRMDKYLRRLDASLLVCDGSISLYVTGNGDVLESPDGIIAIGSGSPYAIAASRALLQQTTLSSQQIAEKAISIAADLDIYTNHGLISDSITSVSEDSKSSGDGDDNNASPTPSSPSSS